jgi:hypothetical protein
VRSGDRVEEAGDSEVVFAVDAVDHPWPGPALGAEESAARTSSWRLSQLKGSPGVAVKKTPGNMPREPAVLARIVCSAFGVKRKPHLG